MIYDNIKRLCEQNHTSIYAVERDCGIGNGTIGKWASRGSSPRVNVLQKVAEYFGVSVSELLMEVGE